MRLGSVKILGLMVVTVGILSSQAMAQGGREKGREGRSATEMRERFEQAVKEGKVTSLRDKAAREILAGKEGAEVTNQLVEEAVNRARQEAAAKGKRNTENGKEFTHQELQAAIRTVEDATVKSEMTQVYELVQALNTLAVIRGENPTFLPEAVHSFVGEGKTGKAEIQSLLELLNLTQTRLLREIGSGGKVESVRETLEAVIREKFPEKAKEIIEKCLA